MIGSVGFIASNASSVAMAPFGERAGAAASLLGAGPVHADLVALVERFSTPPPRTFVIDVGKGTVGGLKVQEPASTYVRRLGIPDYVGSLETRSKVEMLWSRTTDPKTSSLRRSAIGT